MISLLVPSRGRPDNISRLYNSVERTTWGSWEIIVRLDDDDPTCADYPVASNLTYITGPRQVMTVYWNECYAQASGDICWHGGDDVTFRTLGWDEIVRETFPPDGIAFVHGHDLSPNGDWLGTHGFLRREWVDAVGYITAPYFTSDYADVWLVDVSDLIGRHVYIPIITEHWHPDFGKAVRDQTYYDRVARHKADDMDARYRELGAERESDAEKLRAVMR